MRPEIYVSSRLVEWFLTERVLSLEQVAEALGNPSKPTVFRKLADIDARASYSHGGRYHTLDRLAEYDDYGIWHFGDICFSRHGALSETLVHLVEQSMRGYYAAELATLLHVRVHNALTHLHQTHRLCRQQRGDQFLYLSPTCAEDQLARRDEALLRTARQQTEQPQADPWAEHVRALLSALNEKQRRLYLGLESLHIGRGGDAQLSRLTAVNVRTIARGRRELLAGNLSMERIRRAGAGRPSMEKKRK